MSRKPIEPPKSWRDLSTVELVALLTRHPPFVRQTDLLWAQWHVADARAAVARCAEDSAWDAERAAFAAWMKKRDGKNLTAYEQAQSSQKRAHAAARKAEARAEQLFKLANETEA